MKYLKKWPLLMILCLSGLFFTVSSCKTGEGCPNQERYQVKTDKDGNLSQKRGKSNLFSQKNRKKR